MRITLMSHHFYTENYDIFYRFFWFLVGKNKINVIYLKQPFFPATVCLDNFV